MISSTVSSKRKKSVVSFPTLSSFPGAPQIIWLRFEVHSSEWHINTWYQSGKGIQQKSSLLIIVRYIQDDCKKCSLFVENLYTMSILFVNWSLSLSLFRSIHSKKLRWKSKSNKNPDALFFQLFQIIMCGEEIHLIFLILIMTSRFCYWMIYRCRRDRGRSFVSDLSLLYKPPGLDLSLPYNTLSLKFFFFTNQNGI